jgi:hypothetical protein
MEPKVWSNVCFGGRGSYSYLVDETDLETLDGGLLLHEMDWTASLKSKQEVSGYTATA